MILDQQDQHNQWQSPVGTVWARTVHIVEKLFLYGVLFIGIHILGGATALVFALLKLAPVPSWVWIELRVYVFLVVPVMVLRLLCVFMTYRSPYNEYYLYILFACVGAFLLDCNLLLSPNLAFPLMSIAYIFQFALDARLPERTRSVHSPGTARVEGRSRTHPEQRPSSSRERVVFFKQEKRPEQCTPVGPFQKVGIWHCTTDEKFARLLRTHLQPKIWQGGIELWDASQILPGGRKGRTLCNLLALPLY